MYNYGIWCGIYYRLSENTKTLKLSSSDFYNHIMSLFAIELFVKRDNSVATNTNYKYSTTFLVLIADCTRLY